MTQQSGRIWVIGGRPLNGTAAIPAAKNSVLPLLAAALLCRGPVRLRAVPRLSDVECSLGLLRGAGCAAHWQGADIVVAGMPSNSTLPGETAAQMRASILFCAPLLARLGRAETSLPGGCNISAVVTVRFCGLFGFFVLFFGLFTTYYVNAEQHRANNDANVCKVKYRKIYKICPDVVHDLFQPYPVDKITDAAAQNHRHRDQPELRAMAVFVNKAQRKHDYNERHTDQKPCFACHHAPRRAGIAYMRKAEYAVYQLFYIAQREILHYSVFYELVCRRDDCGDDK